MIWAKIYPGKAAPLGGSNRLRYGNEVNNLIRFKAFLNEVQLIPTLCSAAGELQLTTVPDQSISNCSLLPHVSRVGLGQLGLCSRPESGYLQERGHQDFRILAP